MSKTGPQRTDPRSFAVRAVSMLVQLAVPIAIGAATILDDGDIGDAVTYFLPLVLVVVGVNFLIAYLQWTRLTYTVGSEDIRVDSGLLSRAARSVPFDRIQDISLEQKLLARMFGLVEVKFETGAGGGDDLKLAYLSESEGERLRRTVRAMREGMPEQAVADALIGEEPEPEPEPDLLFAMPPKRVLTFGMFEFSLAVFAVLGGLAQTFETALPWELWDLDAWQDRLAGPGQYLAGLGLLAQIIGVAVALATLSIVGIGTGLVRTALREWDFRLERTAKGLRRRRGLLTRTDLVMPAHRVQAVRIGTGIVRRRFGWHSLKVVSLASDSGSANHDAVPFAQMDEIEPVVRETGFRLPAREVEWHRPSAKAHLDAALIDVGILALVTIVVALASPLWWTALLPLSFGVFAAMREAFLWRFNRNAYDETQVYSRHGWLAPRLTIGSRGKLQSVEIVHHPLARLRGYADVRFGLAGGRLNIRGVPLDRALALREATLESMARIDFSDTMESSA